MPINTPKGQSFCQSLVAGSPGPVWREVERGGPRWPGLHVCIWARECTCVPGRGCTQPHLLVSARLCLSGWSPSRGQSTGSPGLKQTFTCFQKNSPSDSLPASCNPRVPRASSWTFQSSCGWWPGHSPPPPGQQVVWPLYSSWGRRAKVPLAAEARPQGRKGPSL